MACTVHGALLCNSIRHIHQKGFGMGINKVILIGNLGKDPELRYTPGGQAVATFSLATTERWNDRNGQRQDRTEWHNIVVWGKQAETVNQYLKKGRSVFIEGRITNRSWDDKDGNKRYKTEIVATNFQFLGGGGSQGGEMDGGADHSMPDFDARPPEPEHNQLPEDDLPF
jgi:single-strand DNA-binding protein